MFTPRQRHERLQCLTGRGLHVQYLAAFGMVLLRLHCQSHTANRSFYLTRRHDCNWNGMSRTFANSVL